MRKLVSFRPLMRPTRRLQQIDLDCHRSSSKGFPLLSCVSNATGDGAVKCTDNEPELGIVMIGLLFSTKPRRAYSRPPCAEKRNRQSIGAGLPFSNDNNSVAALGNSKETRSKSLRDADAPVRRGPLADFTRMDRDSIGG
jgi:hypothetical protein